MTFSTAINSMASSYAKSTSASSAKSTTTSIKSTTASEDPSFPSAFGEMVTQASLSSLPSKTLSPEVLAATVPSTTIQTSGYVFDPLGVVGTVPESNTFLQAIRQMMGKPLSAPATEQAAPATAVASTTAAALTPFGNLPAASTAMPAAPAMQTTPTTLPTAQKDTAGSTHVVTTSVADFLSSVEAQLNYQGKASEAEAAPAQATILASTLGAAMTGDLVDQYLADTSAAASAKAQSALAGAVDKEAQAA